MKQTQLAQPTRLTIAGVFAAIRDKIAKAEGKNSQKVKLEAMQRMIAAAQRDEVKYLVRAFQAKLRVGIQNQTVLQALSHAFVFSSRVDACDFAPEAGEAAKACPSSAELEEQLVDYEQAVKDAYCCMPNYDTLTKALARRELSVEKLGRICKITPGIPLKPMLAKPTKGVVEVLERLNEKTFTAEYKYDGERAQLHVYKNKSGKTITKIYSRNSENMTQKYPELLALMQNQLSPDVSSIIVDSEVVAYEPATKTIQPFQKLSTRAKKDVRIEDVKVQVCLFAFDLIFLNGKPIVKEPLRRRRELLKQSLKYEEGKLRV